MSIKKKKKQTKLFPPSQLVTYFLFVFLVLGDNCLQRMRLWAMELLGIENKISILFLDQ